MMELRRATFGAAVRLAMMLSVVAAIVTITLDAIADVSPAAMMATVATVGFIASWVQTGRVTRAMSPRPLLVRSTTPVARLRESIS